MGSAAERLQKIVRREIREAEGIAGRSHRLGDLGRCFVVIGASLEVFLDKHLTSSDRGGKLKNLIDAAGDYGLSPSSVSVLQEFREPWYNGSKHRAHFAPGTQESLAMLHKLETAINELVGAPIPGAHTQMPRETQRLFWLGFWDHYIGGDTEVHVVLPSWSNNAFAQEVDTIYINMSAWDQIKADLPSIGSVQPGENAMPPDIYRAWSEEDDFLSALTFEGDYRQLIAALAKHERREDLLPQLLRENQENSMVAACSFAAVLAAQEGLCAGTEASVRSVTALKAEDQFAAPARSGVSSAVLDCVCELVCSQPPELRQSLSGPEWVSAHDFEEELRAGASTARSFNMAITVDCRFIIRSS